MIAYLVLIAVLNTALGFVMAVYVLPPSHFQGLKLRPPRFPLRRSGRHPQSDSAPTSDEEPCQEAAPPDDELDVTPPPPDDVPPDEGEVDAQSAEEPASAAPPPPAISVDSDDAESTGGPSPSEAAEPVAEIPEEWLTTLDEYGIEAASMVEASSQVLRLEVSNYRTQIVQIDDRARKMAGSADAGKLQMLLDELRETNETWLSRQAESTRHLESRRGSLGEQEATTGRLLETLTHQQTRIEALLDDLATLDVAADPEAGIRHMLIEIRQLLDLAHSLRDRMMEMLLGIKKMEDRLDELDQSMMFDGLTKLHNRAGLEKVLQEQCLSNQNRSRQVSFGLVDIDRFTRLMDQYGPIACDRLLKALGPFLDSLLRKDRGFDLTARFDGQRFLLLMADTGPRGAMSAVERIRQSIEETQFALDEQTIEITLQCGVAELGPQETAEALYGRLEAAVETAKREGRNCTALDEGSGPEKIVGPTYNVNGKIVPI